VGLGARGPRPRRHPLTRGLVSVALLAGACTAPPPEDGTQGPIAGPSASATPPASLRLAISFPSSLDPRDLDTPDSLLLASQVFDGLVSYDPESLEVLPAAAERWEVKEDGLRFVFHLRQGMTFHDGSPVRAQDFVFAWNRLADPLAAKPYAFLLERVEGFQRYQEQLRVGKLSGLVARDDRTLEVTLTRPWLDFVALLGHPALSPVPPSANGEGFALQPAGNGPFRVAAPVSPGTPLLLQRFEGYYGAPPAVPTLEYRPFEDPTEAWPEFLAGQLDLAPVPPPLLAEAQSRFGDRGIEVLARLLYCGFNERDERFEDPDLRRAVALAVGRNDLAADVYAGVAVPATGIVPPPIPGYRGEVCADRCEQDLDRARALLAEVPRRARIFSLDYPASPVADGLARGLAAQLEAVGLDVTPRPHDDVGYQQVLERGLYEMFCLVWVADYPRQQAFLEPLLESTSADNHAGFGEEDLDTLLDRARTSSGAEVRQEIYAEIERMALLDMHVIPVVWFRSHLAVQPSVEGFVLDPMARYDAAALGFG
jgi:oligopeptide transport system substrate-binding protein